MANKLDAEMERLKSASTTDSAAVKESADRRLTSLESEIQSSEVAEKAKLACEIDGDVLSISIQGHPIGEWRVEGANLALYRAGAEAAECHATSAAEAAKMTSRLVAAAGQA